MGASGPSSSSSRRLLSSASLTLVSRAGMNLATISTPTSENPAPISTARPSASVNADFAAVARASASSCGSDAAS